MRALSSFSAMFSNCHPFVSFLIRRRTVQKETRPGAEGLGRNVSGVTRLRFLWTRNGERDSSGITARSVASDLCLLDSNGSASAGSTLHGASPTSQPPRRRQP